jgi:hypothetical protein
LASSVGAGDYEEQEIPSFKEFYDTYKDDYAHKEPIHTGGKHPAGREFRGKNFIFNL